MFNGGRRPKACLHSDQEGKSVRFVSCVMTLFLLLNTSCGNGSQDTFRGATRFSGELKAYSFSGGVKKDEISISKVRLTENATIGLAFKLDMKKRSTPVLFELTNFTFDDLTTSSQSVFAENQRWQTIMSKVDNQILTAIRITPFTHMAACLSQYKLTEFGQATSSQVQSIVNEASRLISKHLGVETILSGPISELEKVEKDLDDNTKHTMLLYAFSQLAKNYSIKNGSVPGQAIHVSNLAQAFCDDLIEDGLLNGSNPNLPPAVADFPLTVRSLRLDFGLALLNAFDNQLINPGLIDREKTMAIANQLAGNTNATLFSSAASNDVIEFHPPSLQVVAPAQDELEISGSQEIFVTISDDNLIDNIQVTINDVSSNQNQLELTDIIPEVNEAFRHFLDSTLLENGAYNIVIEATDIVGNEATEVVGITIVNP